MHCSLWNMIYSGWSNGEDHRYPLKLFTACQDFLSQECEGWYIARKELALRNNLSRAEALQDPGGICGQELIGLSTEIFPKKPSGVSPLRLGKQKDVVASANTLHSHSPAMRAFHADCRNWSLPPKSNTVQGKNKITKKSKIKSFVKVYDTITPWKQGTVWRTPWTKLLSTKKSSEIQIWSARLVGNWD